MLERSIRKYEEQMKNEKINTIKKLPVLHNVVLSSRGIVTGSKRDSYGE